MKKHYIFLAAAVIFASAVSCVTSVPLTITDEESALINESSDTMRVLTVCDDADLAVLRAKSRDFNVRDLNTREYAELAQKMVKTLKSCDGGVGLAAPQIGINSDRADQPREIREDITGFTAVIFQHEADHLDGILYTDRLN